MGASTYSDWGLYTRLLRQARPCWPHIAVLFLLSLLATPIALLLPLPLKIVVDSVFGSHPLPGFLRALLPGGTGPVGGALALAVASVVVIALLDQAQKLGSGVLSTYTAEKLILNFRAQLFRHGQRLSLAYHDAKGTADSIYRIQSDAAAIQWLSIYGVGPFLSAGFMLVGMIYVTAQIDWHLAVVALAVCPLIFLATWIGRVRLRKGWEATKSLESTAYGVVQEALTSLRVVKAFGQEAREQERFTQRSGEGMRARVRMALVEGGLGLVVALITAAGTALVLFLGGRNVQAGRLTPGELILVMGYLALLYGPVQVISKSITTMQSALASAARAFRLLDEGADVVEKPGARPLSRARGAVAFHHVSFAYNGDQLALHDVSFAVPPGARVGIAGATGAGKTTLVNLLSRFYDPTAGQVLLDGTDLRDYVLADLRGQFSIVLQESVLFSASVAENIAYGRPDASDQEILEAARAANAHEFISNLPEGYQTLVGERGMRLSGGERQRIALARAFLKDAPILILDEPTSAVDVHTEAGILEAMERLMRGRTTFLIAHRLSTLAGCDMRLDVDGGRVRIAEGRPLIAGWTTTTAQAGVAP
jgi:ATP-binding cassette subfamily B protein